MEHIDVQVAERNVYKEAHTKGKYASDHVGAYDCGYTDTEQHVGV